MTDPKLREHTWAWLLAFVAVAEAGSVVGAARQLGLTPAAVSRTVRLFEERLGHQLFNRVGRSLALNAQGQRLRDAVQQARDHVDRGLALLSADPFAGPLRVASLGVLTEHYVMPALIALKQRHPRLLPEHLNLGTADAHHALSRGQLDVAFHYEALSAEAIVTQRLGHTTMSVYCGRGHALYRKRNVSMAQVLEHPFSVPQLGDNGRVMDGWPVELPRRVGMRVTLLRSNLQVALDGGLLTVLPDVTATPFVRSEELHRVPFTDLPTIEVFASYAASADLDGSVAALVSNVRDQLARERARPANRPTKTPRATRTIKETAARRGARRTATRSRG